MLESPHMHLACSCGVNSLHYVLSRWMWRRRLVMAALKYALASSSAKEREARTLILKAMTRCPCWMLKACTLVRGSSGSGLKESRSTELKCRRVHAQSSVLSKWVWSMMGPAHCSGLWLMLCSLTHTHTHTHTHRWRGKILFAS